MPTDRPSARPFRFIGRGVYSVPEAERLTGIPAKRIRRWTQGYVWGRFGFRRHSAPVVANEISSELGEAALDFADLVEIRFLNAFLEYGVSWKSIRIASQRAKELLGIQYPFSSKRFATDGHTILAQFVTEVGDEMLLDLVRNQYELQKLIDACLVGQIDWDEHDSPARWWPLDGSRRIVIDPKRAFGAPIVAVEGVPTRVLAAAFKAEESIDLVATYFAVDPLSVKDAVRYEALRDAA
jgi:uncharacterized protein (DUF433 family)